LDNRDVLRGEVRKTFNISTKPETIYEYLSDTRNLLTHVPNAHKLQLRKNSGRARLFFNITILGNAVEVVIDVEPVLVETKHNIRLVTPPEPLGSLPPGHLTGKFEADISIEPNDKGGSRVSTLIVLEFAPSQIELLNFLSPAIIRSTGLTLLQEYVSNMSTEYIVRLTQDFPTWLKQRTHK
jgi:carbon monoxide dehydrogenase subunit G